MYGKKDSAYIGMSYFNKNKTPETGTEQEQWNETKRGEDEMKWDESGWDKIEWDELIIRRDELFLDEIDWDEFDPHAPGMKKLEWWDEIVE